MYYRTLPNFQTSLLSVNILQSDTMKRLLYIVQNGIDLYKITGSLCLKYSIFIL